MPVAVRVMPYTSSLNAVEGSPAIEDQPGAQDQKKSLGKRERLLKSTLSLNHQEDVKKPHQNK